MKKINGYIDVSTYLKEKGAPSLDIGDLDYEKFIEVEYFLGYDRLAFWFDNDGEKYLFKVVPNAINAYLELICERIAKNLKIPCAHYQMANFENNTGIVTQNFKKKDTEYKSGETLLIETYHLKDDGQQVNSYNNIQNIIEAFKYYCDKFPNNTLLLNKLTNQLIMLFIFDIITNQADRKANNWGLEITEDDINIAPIFDNQESFGFNNRPDNYSLYVTPDNYHNHDSKEIILEQFISIIPDEFRKLLKLELEKIEIKQICQNILVEEELLIPYEIQCIIEESFTQNKETIKIVLDKYEDNPERDEQNERKNR